MCVTLLPSNWFRKIPSLELVPLLLSFALPGAIEPAYSQEGAARQHQDGKQSIWLDVPYVRQPEEGCGAACLSMILRYWGDKQSSLTPQWDTDPQAIAEILYTPQVKGIPGTKMEGFLRERGFRTFVFAASLSDLYHHLSLGRPLIVCIKPERHRAGLHYLIVAGSDPGAEVVLVNDPARRKLLKLTSKSFESAWARTGHWTLLAVPESGSPQSSGSSP